MHGSLRRSGTFFGQTQSRFRTGDLLLVESCFEPGFKSPTHSHERPFCYLVLAGSCTQNCGIAVCANPNHPSWSSTRPAKFIRITGTTPAAVAFTSSLARAGWQRVREHSRVLDRPAEFRGGMAVWLAARLYQELRMPDDLSPLAIEGMSLELVAQAGRSSAPNRRQQPPVWLERVKALAAPRLRERLTLAEMAREAGVHPVHLVTVFRRYMHRTPFDFLRQLRVEFAAGQLVSTRAPLVEIALTAGFSHHSHLCRVFKTVTGMTPASYRGLFARRS